MTTTMIQPHPDGCAIYHIAGNVSFTPNNGLFPGKRGEFVMCQKLPLAPLYGSSDDTANWTYHDAGGGAVHSINS